MTITFPRLRSRSRAPRHKAIDEVARLRHQLDGAELHMKGLRLQVMDAEDARDQAVARANELADADGRRALAEQQLAAMADELTALRQFKANVNGHDVEQVGHRDIDAGDAVTVPVKVVTLAEHFGPARTTWGVRNEQAGVA